MGYRTDTAIGQLLNQFVDGDRIIRVFRSILLRMEDSDDILSDLSLKRWIDSATGIWLDIIGAIVGVARPPENEPDGIIFTYKGIGDPDDPNKGFNQVGDTVGGHYSGFKGLPSSSFVSDVVYRTYIKAKAINVTAKGTIPDITKCIDYAFGYQPNIDIPVEGMIVATFSAPLSNDERYLIMILAPVSSGISFFVTW